MRARAAGWRGSRPKRRTSPEVGRRRPVAIRIVVVFPAPFGPRNPWTSPRRTSRSRRSRTSRRPKRRETERRRKIQEDYNREHKITPQTIRKNIQEIRQSVYEMDYLTVEPEDELPDVKDATQLERMISELRSEMKKAASELEFEKAARLRDKIKDLQRMDIFLG